MTACDLAEKSAVEILLNNWDKAEAEQSISI